MLYFPRLRQARGLGLLPREAALGRARAVDAVDREQPAAEGREDPHPRLGGTADARPDERGLGGSRRGGHLGGRLRRHHRVVLEPAPNLGGAVLPAAGAVRTTRTAPPPATPATRRARRPWPEWSPEPPGLVAVVVVVVVGGVVAVARPVLAGLAAPAGAALGAAEPEPRSAAATLLRAGEAGEGLGAGGGRAAGVRAASAAVGVHRRRVGAASPSAPALAVVAARQREGRPPPDGAEEEGVEPRRPVLGPLRRSALGGGLLLLLLLLLLSLLGLGLGLILCEVVGIGGLLDGHLLPAVEVVGPVPVAELAPVAPGVGERGHSNQQWFTKKPQTQSTVVHTTKVAWS